MPGMVKGAEAAVAEGGSPSLAHAPPLLPVAGVKRRRVTTSRWQAHALGEFDDAVRVARRDGVT